jgi:CPA1 family monovalent cation:H+ antiporter
MIASESLFNDGEGAVIFSLLPGVLVSGITRTTGQVHAMLLHEARGGLLLGQATFIRLKTALSLSWRTSA